MSLLHPPFAGTFAMDAKEEFELKDVWARKREVTDKISTQVRTISAGMVLFAWSVMSASANTMLAKIADREGSWVSLVALFAIFALVSDYIQYVLGLRVTDITLAHPKDAAKTKYEFPVEKPVYKAQYVFFWAKQIFCFAAVLVVIVIVLVGCFVLA
ncbi:MAG TPA: hypothetical protein VGC07_05405 [Granulicella sp.]